MLGNEFVHESIGIWINLDVRHQMLLSQIFFLNRCLYINRKWNSITVLPEQIPSQAFVLLIMKDLASSYVTESATGIICPYQSPTGTKISGFKDKLSKAK